MYVHCSLFVAFYFIALLSALSVPTTAFTAQLCYSSPHIKSELYVCKESFQYKLCETTRIVSPLYMCRSVWAVMYLSAVQPTVPILHSPVAGSLDDITPYFLVLCIYSRCTHIYSFQRGHELWRSLQQLTMQVSKLCWYVVNNVNQRRCFSSI